MMAKLMLFSIGLLMSFNSFAASPSATYATKQDIITEATVRANVDTTLQSNISAEAAARAAADTALQSKINANGLPPLPAERFQTSLKLCGNSDIPQWGPCYYAVGDTGPAGGKVFLITDGGLHGLEAAPEDQSTGAAWGCYSNNTVITGADGTVTGTGAQNTLDILAGCNEAGIAAIITDAYSLNGYTDWFLPSKNELSRLYIQREVVGGFAADGNYWSSSEVSIWDAWSMSFYNAIPVSESKNNTLRVRAVRAF